MDQLVDVASWGIGAGAGRAPVTRSSGPENQDRIQKGGSHALSATSEVLDKFWADADWVSPSQ